MLERWGELWLWWSAGVRSRPDGVSRVEPILGQLQLLGDLIVLHSHCPPSQSWLLNILRDWCWKEIPARRCLRWGHFMAEQPPPVHESRRARAEATEECWQEWRCSWRYLLPPQYWGATWQLNNQQAAPTTIIESFNCLLWSLLILAGRQSGTITNTAYQHLLLSSGLLGWHNISSQAHHHKNLGLSSTSMILHHSHGNNVSPADPATASGSMFICKQILVLIAIFRDISVVNK